MKSPFVVLTAIDDHMHAATSQATLPQRSIAMEGRVWAILSMVCRNMPRPQSPGRSSLHELLTGPALTPKLNHTRITQAADFWLGRCWILGVRWDAVHNTRIGNGTVRDNLTWREDRLELLQTRAGW
ncbi:MAG: hypothetical protein AAF637_08340 [Pseudomonadota bacterium]